MRFFTALLSTLTITSALGAVTIKVEEDDSRRPGDSISGKYDAFFEECRPIVISFLSNHLDELVHEGRRTGNGGLDSQPTLSKHSRLKLTDSEATELGDIKFKKDCMREWLQETFEHIIGSPIRDDTSSRTSTGRNTGRVSLFGEIGAMKGEMCNTYKDCGSCGFFERCCFKNLCARGVDRGVCACGVDEKPKGTCH